MAEVKKIITVKIFRFNPKEGQNPKYQTYKIPLTEGMSVLSILKYIYENEDSSLAFYYSCRIGKCNGCYLIVNGKIVKACTTIVHDDITIEPLHGFKIIRDLVVDLKVKT
ncbi:MAG: 2Fe-2S iron-sulfur cluster-binding protein [Nitrososphaerales archaeon]